MAPESASERGFEATHGRRNIGEQQTTDQIFLMLREIRVLQIQVAQLAQARTPASFSLHHFLDDISEYAESVHQGSESNSLQLQAVEEANDESESEDFYSVEEFSTDSVRPSTRNESQTTTTPEHMAANVADEAPNSSSGVTQRLPDTQPTLLPSSSSLSERSAWSYTSIRIRISNRLYSFKTADDTARNVISAISFLDPAVRAVRLARQQGVVPLSDAQKTWIDQQIAFAEQSMDRAALLVEPARIDLQKRSRVRFARRISFVLRDSPRINACFDQLSVAGARLNEAASILYGNSYGASDSASGMSVPAPPYSLI